MPPVVKPIFSQRYWAVRKRIQRLPQLMIGQMKVAAKKDAAGVIATFRFGIINDSLRLKKLKPRTVDQKRIRGWDQPDTPLYGIGFRDPRTYINMLHVVNKGNRMFVVEPKRGFHRKDPDDPDRPRLKLKDLFDVHEYGTVITNGFGRGIMIRIPPRPALRYAYRLWMKKRMKEDPTVAVRAAIAKYVNAGDRQALERVRRKMEKGFEALAK